MQYIWEVVLAAEKNGIREADLRYEVAEVRSPYLEVSFYDLNTQTVEQTAVIRKNMEKQRKSLWMRYFIIWR